MERQEWPEPDLCGVSDRVYEVGGKAGGDSSAGAYLVDVGGEGGGGYTVKWLIDLLEWLLGKATIRPVRIPDPPPETDWRAELIHLHNARRASPLRRNEDLMTAAQDHAEWMAERETMSHRGRLFSLPGQRIKVAGYDWATYGENIARGQETAAQVFDVWMHSWGHRRNILNRAYAEIGVGRAKSKSGELFWCVDFGSRAASAAGKGGSPIDRMPGGVG